MGQHDGALQSGGDRLAAALAFAGAGAWEYDLAAERNVWRENIDTLFGLEPGTLGPTVDALVRRIHPDDRPGFLACMEQCREHQRAGRTGRVEFDDFRVRLPDGSVRWLRSRASVTERGTLEGVVVDVTQRRHAQQKARERAERFDALVRASPDVILVVDRDGRIAFVSDAVEDLIGRPPAEFIGRHATELAGEFLTDEMTQAQTRIAELLSGDRTEGYVEQWLRRPDGELLMAETHHRAVSDASGEPAGYVAVVRDITHHLRTQEELITAREAAEAGVRAKSQFMGRTSHELRTPMNAVLGFAQLLEMDEDLSPDARSSVEHILQAGRHLLVLLDDVLDLARVDSGGLRTVLEPVDVRQVVTEGLQLVRARAAERGIHIEIDTACPSAVIRADAQRLRQVLLNLLTNAVTYNRDAGTVDVSWTVADEAVRIEVRDTGRGIVEEDLERLFVPFERLDAEQRGIPGTGLGLSLSRSLVQAMGGRLDVASTPGRGSTFSVTLPAAPSMDAATDPADEEATPGAPSRGRVVYIDDNAANLMLVRKSLSRLPGVQLLTATDATGGVALMRRELPDLVLLDLQLPDRRGEDVLAEMRRTPTLSTIPAIVVSSDPSPHAEAEARRIGVTEYLHKPLDIPGLIMLVERMLPQAGP